MKRVDRCKRRAPGPASGFTLIELMITIAILAVVAVLSWRGLDQIIRGREAVARVMADERVVAQTFDQVGADARAAATDDTVAGNAIRVGPGLLQIVRQLDVPGRAPRLQVIRYQVQNRQLYRLASPPLASVGELRAALQSSGPSDDPGGNGSAWSRVSLIRGVSGMQSRAWLDDRGLTASMADVSAAAGSAASRVKDPTTSTAPLFRSVTGVEIRVAIGTNPAPFVRLYPVGQ